MLGQYDLVAFAATTTFAARGFFYEDVLGLDFVEETSFALIFNANGTILQIQKVSVLKPASYLSWDGECATFAWQSKI